MTPQVAPSPMATSMIATPYAQAAPPALPMATAMMATPHAQQPAMAGYDPAAYGAYGASPGYPTGYGQQYAQPGQQYAQPAQQYAEYPQGTQYPQDQYGAQYGAQYPQDQYGAQYGAQYPRAPNTAPSTLRTRSTHSQRTRRKSPDVAELNGFVPRSSHLCLDYSLLKFLQAA